MIVQINKEVFKKFPKLKIVLLLAKKIDNKTRLNESKHLLKEMQEYVHLTFNKESLKTHDLISPWNVAKEEFGEKAHHYHTSVERLMNKVTNRKTVITKDVLTNLLRYIAIKELIPFGVDDLDKIKGEVNFNVAERKGWKGPLKILKHGDLYYHDQEKILGTKLDYWKCLQTALTKNSVNALIHFDILPPINKKLMDKVIDETEDLVKSFTKGNVKVFVLDKNNLSVRV